MALPVIKIEHINHKGTTRIGLFFDYNEEIINCIKKLPGRKWSQSKNCWYFAEDEKNTGWPKLFNAIPNAKRIKPLVNDNFFIQLYF